MCLIRRSHVLPCIQGPCYNWFASRSLHQLPQMLQQSVQVQLIEMRDDAAGMVPSDTAAPDALKYPEVRRHAASAMRLHMHALIDEPYKCNICGCDRESMSKMMHALHLASIPRLLRASALSNCPWQARHRLPVSSCHASIFGMM